MNFKLGDRVTWTSSSAGTTKTKTGAVVLVLGARASGCEHVKNAGRARDHVSYIVRSDEGRKYWPRVAALKAVPS